MILTASNSSFRSGQRIDLRQTWFVAEQVYCPCHATLAVFFFVDANVSRWEETATHLERGHHIEWQSDPQTREDKVR